ncbi:MAG: membrane protein insertase YidC [Verrucomicrobia bacterium]|nr:membrane protein insertase YidC [Verrucomicrobiota bacterium]
MDRKSILLLVVCVVFILAWGPLMTRLYPPKPVPRLTNLVGTATDQFKTNPGASPNAPPSEATLRTGPTDTLPAASAPEQLLVVQNDNARYTFTSRGGGLQQIELRRYPESIACNRKQNGVSTNFATLNADAPVPAMAVLGGDAVLGDGVFTLSQAQTATGLVVRAEKQLPTGLRLVKAFQLQTNYLVEVSVHLENRTGQPLVVPPQEWVIGTATPMDPADRGLMMGLYWYNGTKAEHVNDAWFQNRSFGCVPGIPRTEYVAGADNVGWAAVHNQFFVLAAVPATNAPRVVARRIELPPPTAAELAADPKAVRQPFGFQTAFVYPELRLAPHQSVARQFTIYAGPKEYNTLARIGSRLGNNLDAVMDFGGFFGFFAKALLLSMNGLHALGLSYGLAIIAITLIIKSVFWPLTQASTRSMKRMQALQPQMKALQEKYKDDPAKMNKKLMEFMKENKVSPLGGCLPMLLQIPVFFGFYRMLQTAIELRGQGFLWACDLSRADTVAQLPGLNFPINPLPLIMGATMFWQAQMTPPSPGVDPMQQKIMKYMPLMFMVFLYNMSAGLTLYWTVQNLLTIAQMKLTKNIAAPTAGPKPANPLPDRRRRP